MTNFKITKRVPFGFLGIWGKCYKLTTYNINYTSKKIQTQGNTYYDIGQDVQLKLYEQDKDEKNEHLSENLIVSGQHRTFETTDAYMTDFGAYECIVQPNDIIYAMGSYWVCDRISEKNVFNPKKQTFYTIDCKKIFDKVITQGV